jgi:hypothetical protein
MYEEQLGKASKMQGKKMAISHSYVKYTGRRLRIAGIRR